MGLLSFLHELIADDPASVSRENNFPTGDFLDRPGALFVAVNTDSRKVTAVRLCDFYSNDKRDTFETFIKEQSKLADKIGFIPNETIFSFYIPDLNKAPRVSKSNNDHFIPYIQAMNPLGRIELADAVFAIKNNIKLISGDKCFSGYTGGVNQSKKYIEFMDKNQRNRDKGVIRYYLDQIQEEFNAGRGISRNNPVKDLIRANAMNERFVDLLVSMIHDRGKCGELLLEIDFPVLYNSEWGQKNITDAQMLEYIARFDMKYLAVEFKNKSMIDFLVRQELVDKVGDWDDAIIQMDEMLLGSSPYSYRQNLGGKTISEQMYEKIKKLEAVIGQACYNKLVQRRNDMVRDNPYLDPSQISPTFVRPDMPWVKLPPKPEPYIDPENDEYVKMCQADDRMREEREARARLSK